MTTSLSPRNAGRSSRKTVRYLAGAALVSGGLVVGALFSPVGVAGAQSDGETTEGVEEAPAIENGEATDGHRQWGRHHRNHHRLENLSEISGISVADLRDGYQAGQTLAETAAANGVDADTLAADLEAAATAHLNEAVAEGHLTQEEADEKIAGLDERIDRLLNTTKDERQENRAARRHHRNHHRLENLSDISGIGISDLRDGYQAGQTLAETAAANGVDADTLAADLEAAATAHLNEAVAEGHLTQEEADEKIAGLDERIDNLLNRTPGDGPRGHGHPHPRPDGD